MWKYTIDYSYIFHLHNFMISNSFIKNIANIQVLIEEKVTDIYAKCINQQ